jgi:predicted O-methyltransferase YrrM
MGFDWHGLAKRSKVVDVGGNFGHTARYLLHHAPNIGSVTVQDLPDVIDQAVKKPLERDLKARLSFQAHNFFEPQPIRDADIFLYRGVFVDWPEEKALEILRSVVSSIKPGALLVINEPIIQNMASSDATNSYKAKITRLLDMQSKSLAPVNPT